MFNRPFSPAYFLAVFPKLLAYLPVTLAVTLSAAAAGTLLGFVLARARLGKRRCLRNCAAAYIAAMRCTPSIVLLFIVFYALPVLARTLFNVDMDGASRAVFVVAALSLLFAAAMAELMRGAWLAVDSGQLEAGMALGLGRTQRFIRIGLPQAAAAALPNFCNALTALMKEGALAYTIGMIDMMGQGQLIIGRNYGAYGLETYLALALIYWALTILIEKSFAALETRLARGRDDIGARRGGGANA